MKNFLSVHDVDDIDALVAVALKYKKDPYLDQNLGKNKKIGILFLNPSLRTRMSTQVAAYNLGMTPIVFNMDKEGWSLEFEDGVRMDGNKAEHIKDAAPVLGQFFDILCIRTFPGLVDREEDYSEQIIKDFAKYCGKPVISLESATLHPLQSLADIITITEKLPNHKPKIALTWAPHIKPLPQCVANSFAQWINAWGKADFFIANPEGFDLKEEFTQGATIVHNQKEALENADFVYVKNWSSYDNYGQFAGGLDSWMPSNEQLSWTNNAQFMHCLPVRRNLELSDEILDGPNSVVTQEAGNREWAAQAVISELLKG